jgi:hypothetical protein
MLSLVSKTRRKFDDFKSIFFGHSRIEKKIEIMELKVNTLERKDELFTAALRDYRGEGGED